MKSTLESIRICGFQTLAVYVALLSTQSNADENIPERARQILADQCSGCHGKVSPDKNFNVLDYEALFGESPTYKKSYISKRSPDDSLMIQLIESTNKTERMPQGSDPLSKEERDVLHKWIKDGAKKWPTDDIRTPVTLLDVYAAVENDLKTLPVSRRKVVRYYSIRHLHNNPTVSDHDLRIFRAALSKLINSLSWETRIHVPVAVDAQKTVLRVDLAELGWIRETELSRIPNIARDWPRIDVWPILEKQYPYGMTYDKSVNQKLRVTANEVYKKTGSRTPILRADWFIVRAATAPLYNQILSLPEGVKADIELEKRLGVDVDSDFVSRRVRRAAFTTSGVSEHNRLVDRFDSIFGAYWKSYDFGSSLGKKNVHRFPLGPNLDKKQDDKNRDEHPFPSLVFTHDGGEIIFNLPNGLQAYLIVDQDRRSIVDAPTNVVTDKLRPLNNIAVINGISCISCHSSGMKTFKNSLDTINLQNNPQATTMLREISPSNKSNNDTKDGWDDILKADTNRFIQSQHTATRKFLEEGDNLETSEPIRGIAKQYVGELSLEDIAAEVGQPPAVVKALIVASLARGEFRELAGVVQDGVVKREVWEFFDSDDGPIYSLDQQISRLANGGIPRRP